MEMTEKKEKVKLKLSVDERLVFASLLPPQGSRMEMALNDALTERVGVHKEESTELEFVILPSGDYNFNRTKAVEKEFEFEVYEFIHIQESAKRYDEKKLLNRLNYKLAGRIIDVVTEKKKEE